MLSLKPIFQYETTNSVIDWSFCEMGKISVDVVRDVLQNLCPTVENMLLVESLDLEHFVALIFLCDTLLD